VTDGKGNDNNKGNDGLAFVETHPSHKNKDVARMGHPEDSLWE
jgi:hypothetical protein